MTDISHAQIDQTNSANRGLASVPAQAATNMKESVRHLIDRQAKNHPNRVFLIEPQNQLEISYLQLQQQIHAIRQHLDKRGLQHGASIAYVMSNGHCCAVTVLGIMSGGYRAVAINLVAGRDSIAYALAHSQCELILTQSKHLTLINDALHCEVFKCERSIPGDARGSCSDNCLPASIVNLPEETGQKDTDSKETVSKKTGPRKTGIVPLPAVQLLDTYTITQWAKQADTTPLHPAQPGDDALLMYTSGTTGKPKGVTLSHANVIAGGHNVATGHQLSNHDRALCVLPLYHINGLCVTLFGPLVASASLVLPERFSTTAFWQLVDDYQCSWLSVVPTQIAYLLRDADANADANESIANQSTDQKINQSINQSNASPGNGRQRPHLRFARSASAPLSPDVHGAFEQRFGIPLIETMGLTETSAQILTNPMPPAPRKPGSAGLPVGNDVVVADEFQQPLADEHEGELLVRGANVMQRYFRNESATAQALVTGGWLRTGDLGRRDKDGYLFITGRLKELIIKGGENIAPREIDDALYQHSGVVEAAAFACPCDDFGQRVEAAVVLNQTSTLTEADLLATCIQTVGRFKCPDRIYFLQELPKGPSGKIQRARILELVSRPAG